MDLQVSAHRYQLNIPVGVWLEFFAQLTEDNCGRLINLKILDGQMGDFEVLRYRPFFAVTYHRPNHGNDLVVTVGHGSGAQVNTYDHVIVCPQTVSIITDEDGIVQSCTVTDDDHAQTVITFQT